MELNEQQQKETRLNYSINIEVFVLVIWDSGDLTDTPISHSIPMPS